MPTLDSILKDLPKAAPDPQLLDRIMLSVRKEKQVRRIKITLGAFTSGFFMMSGLMAFFWQSFRDEIAFSPFRDYLNLVIADQATLSLYWKQVTLSLLESMPIYNLMAWLLMAFFGFGLISKAYELIRSNHDNNKLYGTTHPTVA